MPLRRVSGDPAKGTELFLNKTLAKETKAVRAGSLIFVGVIKEMLSHPGTGKIRVGGRERVGKGSFNRGKDGKLHMVHRGAARVNIDPTNRASAPGQPPAPDNSVLRNSIDYELTSETTSRVGTNVVYAEPLEFGTLRIAPRPFMRPSKVIAAPLMGPVIAGELRHGGE
jgi:hypothetical protein